MFHVKHYYKAKRAPNGARFVVCGMFSDKLLLVVLFEVGEHTLYSAEVVGGVVVYEYATLLVAAEYRDLGAESALHSDHHIFELQALLRGRRGLFGGECAFYELFEVAHAHLVVATLFGKL